jgi:hypothetical protein
MYGNPYHHIKEYVVSRRGTPERKANVVASRKGTLHAA